ncbi:Papain family cysteine protease [compost metagenome]
MRKYTVKRDKRDFRDISFRSVKFVKANQLPRSVDLRSRLSPIVDQGKLGSCTSNAIVSGLREFLLLEQRYPFVRLSRLYHYWHERKLEGKVNIDSGATIRDGMKVLQKNGVCTEADWPYRVNNFREQPSERAEISARVYRIGSYHRVPDLLALKAALAEEQPVAFGISIYSSFEGIKAKTTGQIPIPNRKTEKRLGGHALLAVGYNDGQKPGEGVIIARNSWGPTWGDQGYCYLPYQFFKNSKLTFDYWTGR